MTWWRRLPIPLRRICLWLGGTLTLAPLAVYALQHGGDAAQASSWLSQNAFPALFVATLGALTAAAGMLTRGYQNFVREQRSELVATRQELAEVKRISAVEIGELRGRIRAMELQMGQERASFLEAERKHAGEVGAARTETEQLKRRIQLLEPLDARVKLLTDDKVELEERVRELRAQLRSRTEGATG